MKPGYVTLLCPGRRCLGHLGLSSFFIFVPCRRVAGLCNRTKTCMHSGSVLSQLTFEIDGVLRKVFHGTQCPFQLNYRLPTNALQLLEQFGSAALDFLGQPPGHQPRFMIAPLFAAQIWHSCTRVFVFSKHFAIDRSGVRSKCST